MSSFLVLRIWCNHTFYFLWLFFLFGVDKIIEVKFKVFCPSNVVLLFSGTRFFYFFDELFSHLLCFLFRWFI